MSDDEAVRKLHESGADDCLVALLDCTQPFQLLNKQEKLYAHYMAAAGFEGMKICLLQCSYESPAIFELLQRIFHQQDVASLAAAASLTELETKQLLSYAGSFFGNVGNYRSFGDTKIVPSLPVARFEAAVLASKAYAAQPAVIQQLWDAVKVPLYALTPRVRSLGLGEDGVSTYYSDNCTKADAEIAQKLLDDKKISPYNTRLFKSEENGKTVYEVRIASVEKRNGLVHDNPDSAGAWSHIRLVYGDYSPLMARVVENLTSAKKYAANDVQKDMLQQYIECFTTGDMEKHIQGSRFWVQDKGPAVETYIGFIESYRDPFGVKGEWEGFAAVVNKEISAKFGNLVTQAEGFLTKLPWAPAFEKDKFLRPDFTSLEVLGFGSGGIPAGINIPNYDSIRQSEGFKNVSLANVLRAGMSFSAEESVTFLSDPDQALYKSTVGEAFDVQVGLHELLGHGSGKLFIEDENKKLNFDEKTTVNPIDGKPVLSWYKPGETWDSKFSSIGSSYEECRAESIGIYLSVYPDILSIFGFEGEKASDITYVNWLNMARAGVLALQFFTPGKGLAGWGQAHMMARYAILQVLLEAGDSFVQIHRGSNNDSYVTLDRSKVLSVGHKAVADFLRKLQVYKSTADYDAGLALYTKYTTVSDDMLTLRAEVIARRKPRRVFVQPVTKVDEAGEVQFTSFDATPEGLIKSFVTRYPCCDDDLLGLWQQDAKVCNPFL